ncbi:MAG: hypothetical protein Kow0062_09470 [Acidobacteriota bacterium]
MKGTWLTCLVLVAMAATAAHATSIRDVRVAADCDGYTIYIEGANFDEGASLSVEWTFVLNYLGPDPAGEDVTVTGSTEVTCDPFVPDPGASSCSPSVEIRVPWTEALGAPLPCGDYEFDLTQNPGGACESIVSRWTWTTIYGSELCNHLYPTGWEVPDDDPYPDWDGVLTCPCEHGEEICRTPGFWGTHAGTEKSGSQNITQAVLDAASPPIRVCGETVTTTMLDTLGSSTESMCVSPRGESRLQLARQLTAAALNCVMTSGAGDCLGVGGVADTFADCNLACENGWSDEYSHCIGALDCWNNGGVMLDSGICQIGTCFGDGVTACAGDRDCGDGETDGACVPLDGNCHDRPLVNEALGLDFDPPGPAGSSKACNGAKKNDCTLFGGCSR